MRPHRVAVVSLLTAFYTPAALALRDGELDPGFGTDGSGFRVYDTRAVNSVPTQDRGYGSCGNGSYDYAPYAGNGPTFTQNALKVTSGQYHSCALPADRMGVYMGIFNFFIVIPEILAALFFGRLVQTYLHGNLVHAVMMGGVCLLIAAVLTVTWVREPSRAGL